MESTQLWKRYKEHGDPAAREALILHYAFLVRNVAERLGIVAPPAVDRDDLISHGIIGLIDAVEQYDYLGEQRFETFASARIRDALLRALHRMGSTPPPSLASLEVIERTVVDLEQKLGRQPSLAEVAAASGLTEGEIEELFSHLENQRPSYLEATATPDQDHSGPSTLTLVPQNDYKHGACWPLLDDTTARADQRRVLVQAIGSLPADERVVLSLYYVEELTIREIGEVIGMDESLVAKIHTRAMMRLRAHLKAQADLFAAA